MYRFLYHLLPRLQYLGRWIYFIVLMVSVLESTAFIGLLVPGTTIIVFVGFLASQRVLHLGNALLIVALGGIIGDAISFYLGRKGTGFFKSEERWLKKSHLEKGEEFFKKHGNKSILLARFIGPLRPIVPFVAGLSKMDTKKFFLFNILSGILDALFYVLAGYFFGHAWGRVRATVSHIEAGLLIAAVVLLIGFLLRRRLNKLI